MTGEESTSSSNHTIAQHNFPFLISEYSALREEIVKRIEIQHQLLSLALIATGTILTIGFQTSNATLMF